ncbi:MAG: hypothetical protein ABJ020_05170 [Parasphingorhabdus sp.]|uniref:hypothetical protein n=1 Tax=Parasphingorhabdus sp. TaxID=2709688 RepID=UPI00326323B6
MELTTSEQILFSALLDLAGAGWIAVGVAVICLILIPARRGEIWARYLIPALVFISYIPTLLATLSVLNATPASPPWWGTMIVLIATMAAFLIDRPYSKDKGS